MSWLPSACDRMVKWGLVVLIVMTPLAFGTVEPWSIALMEWGIFTISVLFLLGQGWVRSQGVRDPVPWTGLEVPLILFLLFSALQTLPLSEGWLRRLSPGSASLYFDKGDLVSWKEIEATEAEPDRNLNLPLTAKDRRPVSVHPAKTWNRIELCAAFFVLCLIVARWADRIERVVFLFGTLTAVGFLVALQGLIQFLTWNGKIYWVRKVPPSSPFGPFVNHNHFAGYVEMIIPLAVSLAFYLLEGDRRPELTGDGGRSKAGLAAFAAVLLIVTLFLSLSRGGIISATLGALFLFVISWRRMTSRWAKWFMAVALPLATVTLIAWIGPAAIRHQFGAFQNPEGETSFRFRGMIWETVLRKFPGFAWFGSGLGTFEYGFAPFTPPGDPRRWDKAHNDYLQLLWESGVVGFSLFLIGALIFLRRYWWPALFDRAGPLHLFRPGIAIALASIALHSLVDFNLQIGANGFLCSLLVGLLIATVRAGSEASSTRPTLVTDRQSPT